MRPSARMATKTDTPLIETPQSITTVTADQIHDQASPTLQEALRDASGVRKELYGIDNRGDYISIRGSKEATILLDGMRLPLTGSWGVVRIEPYAYDRMEIVRGPSSIIAGANDPGGVLNLVSKRPRPEAVNEIGVQLGNYDLRQMNADFGGTLDDDGTLLYRLVALGKDSNTQIDHAVLPGLAPYASYSESFNPVGGFDADGRPFEPKRGRQIEAGLKWESQSVPLRASAAYYSIKEKNRLASDPNSVGRSIQIGQARIKGSEIEAQGEIGAWRVIAGYSYVRARASADDWGGDLNPDEQIEGIPKHMASAWLVHDFAHLGIDGLSVGAGMRYVRKSATARARCSCPP